MHDLYLEIQFLQLKVLLVRLGFDVVVIFLCVDNIAQNTEMMFNKRFSV